MKFNKHIVRSVLILLIFFFALFCRICLIPISSYMQIDEPSSFYVSTPSNLSPEGKKFKESWDKFSPEFSVNYKISELQKSYFEPIPTIHALFKDLELIRKQKMDRQHPSLYFQILRIWNHNLSDFDYDKYLNHARNLNIIFFIFSFFFMYKLLNLIKNDTNFVTVGLILAFLSIGSISHDLLAREYSLQSCFFILTTYICLKLYKIEALREQIPISKTLKYSLGIALFLLSGYFSIIYTGFVFLLLFFQSLIKKNYTFLKQLLLIIFLSCTIVWLFCPFYFDIKTNNEHTESVFTRLLSPQTEEIYGYFIICYKMLEKLLFYPFIIQLIIFLAILSIYKKIKPIITKKFEITDYNAILLILFLVFIWIHIVIQLTPYKCYRFISPAIPVLSIALILFLYRYKTFISYIVTGYFILIILNSNFFTFIDRMDRVFIPKIGASGYQVIAVNPSFYMANLIFSDFVSDMSIRFEDTISLKDLKEKNVYILSKDKQNINRPSVYINKMYFYSLNDHIND